MEVNIKDRDEYVEYIRMALAMCEFGVSHEQADLINEVCAKVAIKQGDFDLKDAAKIFAGWKQKWQTYKEDVRRQESKKASKA